LLGKKKKKVIPEVIRLETVSFCPGENNLRKLYSSHSRMEVMLPLGLQNMSLFRNHKLYKITVIAVNLHN